MSGGGVRCAIPIRLVVVIDEVRPICAVAPLLTFQDPISTFAPGGIENLWGYAPIDGKYI